MARGLFWVYFTTISFVVILFGGLHNLVTTASSTAMASGQLSGITAFVIDNWLMFIGLFFVVGIIVYFSPPGGAA